MDTWSTSYLTNDDGNFSHKIYLSNPHSIIVGKGINIPSLGQISKLSLFQTSLTLSKMFTMIQKLLKTWFLYKEFVAVI